MAKLIVLDGLDGSGKSTQLDAVDAWMTARGIPHKQISFPDYSNPSSALVRQYLAGDFGTTPDAVGAYAASSFYAVDRYASFKSFWQTDYEDGTVIVAARYTTSNAIHQMSKLPEEQWDAYLAWLADYEYRLLGLPKPDLVMFLDMPPEVSQALMTSRYEGDESKKDIHERDRSYLLTCRKAALYAAEHDGWQVVPCAENGAPRTIESITASLTTLVESVL
ncbi:MAG: thymidylate kinase [Clostridia bacterium]|nr:thymidylate kinase [Clostridia bacterium]